MSLLTAPLHPGEVLRDLYIEPAGLTPISLAKRLGVPRTRIERLVKGQSGVTPDTALRLARVFGSTPEMWMAMQSAFDLAKARETLDVSRIEAVA